MGCSQVYKNRTAVHVDIVKTKGIHRRLRTFNSCLSVVNMTGKHSAMTNISRTMLKTMRKLHFGIIHVEKLRWNTKVNDS